MQQGIWSIAPHVIVSEILMLPNSMSTRVPGLFASLNSAACSAHSQGSQNCNSLGHYVILQVYGYYTIYIHFLLDIGLVSCLYVHDTS